MCPDGSSPRMRGTPRIVRSDQTDARIIPAHAGNSCFIRARRRVSADHPRACGELNELVTSSDSSYGSSPRMRGTPLARHRSRHRRRIIPAHAGNSAHNRGRYHSAPDHPRACGELSLERSMRNAWAGSSPRMRGTLSPYQTRTADWRIIPAHAGNSWRQQ